jgi:predicted AAA+ superfamily ATPase
MELIAYRGINDFDFDIRYWRTKSQKEIDFILGDAEVAIEVKLNDNFKSSDLAFATFCEEYKPKHCIVVTICQRPRKIKAQGMDVLVLPWQEFLTRLWEREII